MSKEKELLIVNETLPWTNAAPGIYRKMIAYDESLMLVEVAFEKGAVGAVHRHLQVQITYVKSGLFEAEVDGRKQVLRAGDSFMAPSNVWHGVVCLEKGTLLDSFSPMRPDFL